MVDSIPTPGTEDRKEKLCDIQSCSGKRRGGVDGVEREEGRGDRNIPERDSRRYRGLEKIQCIL